MIGFLRRAFPQLRIVLGGGLVTSWMRRPDWKNSLRGPRGRADRRTGRGPASGPPREGTRRRPGPAGPRRLSPDRLPGSPGTILPYSASSGCWWRRCSFCPERAEGNPYRPLPPAQVTADLRALVAETRPALIHLLDNALSPALSDALAAEPPGCALVRLRPDHAPPRRSSIFACN